MLTSITNAAAFFLAAIIPIPALRTLCIQASHSEKLSNFNAIYLSKKPSTCGMTGIQIYLDLVRLALK